MCLVLRFLFCLCTRDLLAGRKVGGVMASPTEGCQVLAANVVLVAWVAIFPALPSSERCADVVNRKRFTLGLAPLTATIREATNNP